MNKISLAGDLGSGKSTIAKILIERLGAEYYSTGAIVREIAQKHGMTVLALNEYMETHREIDREIDDGLRRLGDDPRALVIDSRMAWHFTAGTFKVYLSTDPETSALRIMKEHRTGEHAETLAATIAETASRRASEKKRYFELYGVNIKDLSNYDLVIDTTKATPERIAAAILAAFEKKNAGQAYAPLLLSPERIYYEDDAPDEEKVRALICAMERGESLPLAEVCECDGEFRLIGGAESVLAYVLGEEDFLPARLVPMPSDTAKKTYVRMKDSL